MRAMGERFTDAEKAAFLAAARTLVAARTPFRHMGRDPAIGVDCAGAPQWCAIQIGRKPWDIPAYGTDPHSNDLRDAMVRNMGKPVWTRRREKAIPDSVLQPCRLALMKFDGEPKHVAIIGNYPNGHSLIHTYGVIGHVTEHRLDSFWQSKILEVFEL